MADRFWAVNAGNINDTAHWSLTSGGASGASVPTLADRAIFDPLSFTLASQIVALNVAFSCLDMDWTGVTNNPSLSNNTLNIYGSLTLVVGMSLTGSGDVYFRATATGKTITTAGKSIPTTINFNGVGGGWTLQDNLACTQTIAHNNGTFDANGKTVTALSFDSSNANLRTLTITNATINVSLGWNVTTTTNLTLNATGSTINVTGASTFAGGGKTYNNVNLTTGTIAVTGSNTFNVLTLTAGKTVNLTSGTTQTVSSIVANGTAGNLITVQAATAGTPCTISRSSGTQDFNYCTIKDCTFTGGAIFNAYTSIDGGGNTGINFISPTAKSSSLSIAISISM